MLRIIQASKADKKLFCSGYIPRKDEHGREKAVPALYVNRAYYDHILRYRKVCDKDVTEALRRRRLDEHAKSKAMAKNWPDSIENKEKSRKLREQEEAERLREEMDKRHELIAWENRAADRKIIADAKKMLWNELPEVREIHRAYLKAQVLHEISAQKEFSMKLKEIGKAGMMKNEGAKRRFHEKEEKQEAEKAMRNKNYWEYIDKQNEERMKLREIDKKEKLREEIEVLKILKHELDGSSEEKIKKAKRIDFLKGLEISEKEKGLLKAERLRDDEELERSIQAYNENIDEYSRAIMAMREGDYIPGARKIVLNQAQNIWETKMKTQMEKENELFQKQRQESVARDEERMKENKRKESEQKMTFKLANDYLIKQKLQNKLLSLKMKNLERIQMIKLFENEKESKINQQSKIKNESQLARFNYVAQEGAKAREKKQYLEEMNEFMKEKNILQDKLEKKLVEYAKKLSNEMQSGNKDSRPIDEVIQLRERRCRMVLKS